jgi:hypothetical protein
MFLVSGFLFLVLKEVIFTTANYQAGNIELVKFNARLSIVASNREHIAVTTRNKKP